MILLSRGQLQICWGYTLTRNTNIHRKYCVSFLKGNVASYWHHEKIKGEYEIDSKVKNEEIVMLSTLNKIGCVLSLYVLCGSTDWKDSIMSM